MRGFTSPSNSGGEPLRSGAGAFSPSPAAAAAAAPSPPVAAAVAAAGCGSGEEVAVNPACVFAVRCRRSNSAWSEAGRRGGEGPGLKVEEGRVRGARGVVSEGRRGRSGRIMRVRRVDILGV